MEAERRSIWDLTPEEELAEDLVDAALAGMNVPAEVLPFVRCRMICELVVPLDEGDDTLRRWAAVRGRLR